MDAVPTLHPADATLHAFGLGKLDDPAAEEVDRHLRGCPACRSRVAEVSADSFLGRVRDARSDGSRVEATRSHADSGAPPSSETLPPGLADHPDYEIKKELGRGGMGVVYLAHNRLMGRDEVLKVMDRALAARPGLVDRFLREIRAVARLRHPNIVTAYSALRLGESIAFAMEYVPGLDLARLVKLKGPMPVAHACLFVHQAALGLQHAFEEGLVHRDIKPGNLILSRRGDRATVKVLDFGLAKATSEQRLDSALTREGQALGTPDYIAPEQILDAPHADIRADLYSLGGTLYFLLTGHPPFRAGSLYDLYQAHISREADPLNLLRPEVPAELAALVAKMLAKEPRRRFQTPAEVAEALRPFLRKGNPAGISETEVSSADHPMPMPKRLGLADRTEPEGGPPRPESRWASLVESRETEPPDEGPEPAPPAAAGRPPRRALGIAIAAAGSLLLLILFGIVIRIRTRAGTEVTITVDQAGGVGSSSGASEGDPTPPPSVPVFNGEDLTGWSDTLPNGSHWEVVDGILVGKGSGSEDGGEAVLDLDQDYPAGFRLSLRILNSDGITKGIYLRHTPPEAPSGMMGTPPSGDEKDYIIAAGGTEDSRGEVVPVGSIILARWPLADGDVRAEPVPVPLGQWYTLEIDAQEDHIATFIDGQEVARLPASDESLERFGRFRIALYSPGNSSILIQDVAITVRNDAPEVERDAADGMPSGEASDPAMSTMGMEAMMGSGGMMTMEGAMMGGEAPEPGMSMMGVGGMMGGEASMSAVGTPGGESGSSPAGPAPGVQAMVGEWSVEDGELVQTSMKAEYIMPIYLIFDRLPPSNYVYSFEGKVVDGGHGFKATFHWSDRRTYRNFSVGTYGNKAHDLLSVLDGRQDRRPDDYRRGSLTPGQWYKITVEVRQDQVRCYLDDQLLFEGSDRRFSEGRVGIGMWGTSARFRNIRLADLDGGVVFEGVPTLGL